MTVANETSNAEYSYQYDGSVVAPPEVIQLWIEVGNGLDKNQTGPCLYSFVPSAMIFLLGSLVLSYFWMFAHDFCAKCILLLKISCVEECSGVTGSCVKIFAK